MGPSLTVGKEAPLVGISSDRPTRFLRRCSNHTRGHMPVRHQTKVMQRPRTQGLANQPSKSVSGISEYSRRGREHRDTTTRLRQDDGKKDLRHLIETRPNILGNDNNLNWRPRKDPSELSTGWIFS
jgi:hypothetical protein